MAYNSYYACDRCGTEGIVLTNRTLYYTVAVKQARRRGWIVGDKGWFCPKCIKIMKEKKK